MTRSGWRLPGYRIEELLGTGASGEVWRATVLSTGVPVALKRIWLSERAQRQAAISEAAVLSALDHPHLMKLHDVRPVEDALVLVLDLAGGGSLASLLARRGRLTVGETLTAIAPIGGALAYAHTHGVVHGDVSSANILFTDIGLPLLADLGMARLLGDAAPVHTTPSYVDPLVAAGDVPGPASDLFMLAGVALHALTGQPPWPGEDAEHVLELAAAIADDPDRLPDFTARMAAAGVPEAVSTVVARALALDPLHRGTTAQFALDLRCAGEPVAVELSAGRPRHAAPMVDSWPLESVPAHQSASGSSPPSPPFARALPLTYGVRAPSPFAQLPSGRHLGRRLGFRLVGGIVAAVAAVALAAGLLLSRGGSSAQPPAAAPVPHAASTTPQTSGQTPGQTSAHISPTAARSQAPDHPSARPGQLTVRDVLAGLDRARASAFARRDPLVLRQVYASPQLLARDRALLVAIVPTGCGLHGVRTRFTGVRAVRRGARLQVRARMALTPSTLLCGGAAAGTAPGTRAAGVVLELTRTGGRYRITAERRAADAEP